MKHTIYRLSVVASALAAVLLTAQCAKETDPAAQSKVQDNIENGTEVSLIATKGDQTRAELTDETTKVSVTWASGDKIYVVGETEGLRGCLTLTAGAGEKTATFKGYINHFTATQNVRFYYAGQGKTITGDTFDLNIALQTGTLDGIEPMHVMCGTLSNVSPSTVSFGSVTMSNLIAIGKFDIINCTGFTYNSDAKLTGAVSSATLNLKNGAWTGQTTSDITLQANLTENYFVALIPSTTAQTLTFSQQGKDTPESLAAKVITAGSEYMSKGLADDVLDNPIEIGIYRYIDDDDNFWGYGRIIGEGDLKVVWAPVNCGFDKTNYKYGRLYQWGRKDGCGYSATWTVGSVAEGPETEIQEDKTGAVTAANENKLYFYIPENPETGTKDWLTPQNNLRWNLAMTSSGPGTPVKASYDPCPDGWRVPTDLELDNLKGEGTVTLESFTFDGQIGCYFYAGDSSKKRVFFQLAGSRYADGPKYRTLRGSYASSSYNYDGEDATLNKNLFIKKADSSSAPTAQMSNGSRFYGYSVRCVMVTGTEASATLPSLGNNDVTW